MFHVPKETTAQYKNVSKQHIMVCLILIYHAFWSISGNRGSKKLIFCTNKHGASEYFSPHMILHQENIDYNCHCKHALGDYVQAHDHNHHKNTTAACSLDCLYLRPTSSKQEGQELIHLQTNHVIMRHKVTSVPVTPSIISQVHALARLDGMPPGLKITSHSSQILFDSAWTAGVDYNEDDFQDEDFEMESEDEEYDEENEEDEYDEMYENELAKMMGEPHPHNVPNENTNQNVNNNLQHDNNDPEDSEETGLEDENKNNNEDSEEEEEEEEVIEEEDIKMNPVQPYIDTTGRGHQTQGINT